MDIVLAFEHADTPGARALIYAAEDELDRRYGVGADASGLTMEDLTPPRGFFVTARDGGHLAGGVGLRRDGPHSALGEVKRLWVRPDLRGAGIAYLLMDRLESEARRWGVTRLYLETGNRQPEAAKFYERTGWHRTANFPNGSAGHPEGRIFEKQLGDATTHSAGVAHSQSDDPSIAE